MIGISSLLERLILEPWLYDFEGSLWVVLMGTLVGLACGWIGLWLVLRRMALVGDAISHSILPGLVLGYLVGGTLALWWMIPGAFLAGWLTTFLIDGVQRYSKIKGDAALGIVFSALFAFGVVLITVFANKIHLDADCVLYGEIGYVAFWPRLVIGGVETLPLPVMQMTVVLLLVVGFVLVLFKELLLLAFDPALGRGQGLPMNRLHYALMGMVALVVVGSFQAVGAILVVAMLIFPAVTAGMLLQRVAAQLWAIVPLSVIYALGGFHLAHWLDAAIAPCMVIVAGGVFGLVWVLEPRRGLLAQAARRRVSARQRKQQQLTA